MDKEPVTGIAKIGPSKWFWVYWPDWDAYVGKYKDYKQEKAPEDPAHGYADSREEAIQKCGGIYVKSYGKVALEWRSIFAARRRKPNLKAAPDVRVTEYAYHQHQSYDEECWTCAHRIIKKTSKKIFIEENCQAEVFELGGVRRVPQLALDRAKLEAGEAVFVNHGRFRGAMCGEYFTLTEPKEREPHIPDCFIALGLKSSPTVAQVKRAFRKLSQKYHPDAGGDAGAFRNLREQYQAALDKVAESAA